MAALLTHVLAILWSFGGWAIVLMILNSSRYVGVEGHIGRTPLLRLRRLSELTGCEILGKAEFMNCRLVFSQLVSNAIESR